MTLQDEKQKQQSNVDQLSTIVALVFTVSFFIIFIAGSYFGRGSIEHLLSFIGNDTPGSFPGSVFPKPIGVHYFGDFLLPRWQSIRSSPWFEQDLTATPINNYLPFTMAVFAAFSRIEYWRSFTIFISISVFSVIVPVWLSTPRKDRVRVVTSLIFLTGPFISLIDRGNIQFLMIGILASALYLFSKGKTRIAAVLLGLGIALKGYPIVLLVVWVKARRWLDAAVALITAVSLTLIPLLFYRGGVWRNIFRILRNVGVNEKEYAHAALAYNSSLKGFLLSIASLKVPGLESTSLFLFRHVAVLSVLIIVLCLFLCLKAAGNVFEVTLLSVVLMTTMVDYAAPYALGLYFLPLIFFGEWVPSISEIQKKAIFLCWAIVLAPKGLPLQFWNTEITSSTPTFTSLLGGFAGMTILCILTSSMYKSWRGSGSGTEGFFRQAPSR